MFNLISGALEPTAGDVVFLGRTLAGCQPFDIARRGIGRTFQHVKLVPRMSVLDNVALGAYLRGHAGILAAALRLDRAEEARINADRAQSGRLVVCQGNLVRNLKRGDPAAGRGIGIAVEADSAITGNVIEGAPLAGIVAGFGKNLRDVTVTGNVVRAAPIGVGVSAAPGAGSALVAHNLIAGATTGAVVGMENGKAVTGDLARDETSRFAQITVSGNRVR
jgi:uncharacterized secreted repeat protein (TIGR03808 family)